MTERAAPTPTGPVDELEGVISLLLTEATALVERNGGFYPFAGRWPVGSDEPQLVRPLTDEAYPDIAALAAELEEALAIEAGAGALHCAGTCLDVLVTLPDEGEVDAVRVNAEVPGRAVTVYLPYRATAGGVRFLDMVRTPGDRWAFVV